MLIINIFSVSHDAFYLSEEIPIVWVIFKLNCSKALIRGKKNYFVIW